jgi:hypothetical protein
MNRLLLFNVAMVFLCAMPRRLYAAFLRGMHLAIGITPPADHQLRWVLVVWVLLLLVVVDAIAFVLDLGA